MQADAMQRPDPIGNAHDPELIEARRLLADADLDGARAALERARTRARRSSDRAREAAAEQALGDADTAAGIPKGALEHYERAQALWHEAGESPREADAWLAIATVRRALGRLPRALEAYRAAAALYDELEDPLGQAHAAFGAGEIMATRTPDAARQDLARAVELYELADQRASGGGLRIANPHLPDHVGDPRAIEPWIMAKIADREIARLEHQPAAAQDRRAAAATEATPAPTVAARREHVVAGIILAAVTLGFVGLALLASRMPAWSVSAARLPYVLVAALAGGTAWFAARLANIEAKALRHAVPAAVAVLVYAASALLFVRHADTARQERLWTELVDAQADLNQPVKGIAAAAAMRDVSAERRTLADALARYEREGNRREQASTLRSTAQLDASIGHYDEAYDGYGRSYVLFREVGDVAAAAEVAANLGDLLRARRLLVPARERYGQAAALYQQLDKPGEQMRTLRKLGDVEASLERIDAAREAYLLAVARAQQLDDAESRFALLLRLGGVEETAKRPERARAAYDQALAVAQQRRDGGRQARAWLAVADLEAARAPAAAQTAFEQSIALANGAGNARIEARAWRHRGDAARSAGQLEVAADQYTRALRTAQTHAQHAEEARALVRLASLDLQLGNGDAARAHYGRAVALYEQLAQPLGHGHAVLGLGDLEATLTHPIEARAAYGHALALYQQAGSTRGQITALERLARITADSEPQQSHEYQVRATALRQQAEAHAAMAAAPAS
jgi:tetratricopeptide (TPR) repeat protein